MELHISATKDCEIIVMHHLLKMRIVIGVGGGAQSHTPTSLKASSVVQSLLLKGRREMNTDWLQAAPL